jgi:OmpA-OmpF porin, OOP family
MKQSASLFGIAGIAMAVALATPGCATKKYVRQTVDPVNQRVSEVDKKHTESIGRLEDKEGKDISRVDERAMGAENRATEAGRAAQTAQSRADQGYQVAQTAQQLSQQNQSKLGDVEKMVNNIDNYKLVGSEKILFGFDKAQLNDDAKAKLDSLAQSADKHSVIEVEGFTDRSGSKDYNLALSRRRADAVVRYLVSHNISLRRIHMIGLGSEQPAMDSMSSNASMNPSAENTQAPARTSGRAARKEMRRVVVRVYAPENAMSASNPSNVNPGQSMGSSTGSSAPATTEQQNQPGQSDQAAPRR